MSPGTADWILYAGPVMATLAFRYSALNGALIQVNRLPLVIKNLFSCALCTCTHFAWIWAIFAGFRPFFCLWTLGYVLACGISAYVLAHIIDILISVSSLLSLQESKMLKSSDD